MIEGKCPGYFLTVDMVQPLSRWKWVRVHRACLQVVVEEVVKTVPKRICSSISCSRLGKSNCPLQIVLQVLGVGLAGCPTKWRGKANSGFT